MTIYDPAKPVTDLSPRVVELARKIDREPPGTILIEIVKDEVRAQDWQYRILRVDLIEHGNLPKRIKIPVE